MRKKSSFLLSVLLIVFLVYFLSDWANFKAGLIGKPPVEIKMPGFDI